MQFETVFENRRFILGEGPHYDAGSGALYWVDIVAGEAWRMDVATRKAESWPFGGPVSAVVPRAIGGLMVARANGLVFFDPASAKQTPFCAPEADLTGNRSNEARVDPTQDKSKLGTSLSKSLPLNEQYSLTLQNGYNVIQQGLVPVPGIAAHPSRNYQTDQSARLSIADTGTSFMAGQTLSTADDKWLRKIGAEQKLFDGVSISGSIAETPQGASNRSISAGFKRSW